jgi:hypothetical protein
MSKRFDQYSFNNVAGGVQATVLGILSIGLLLAALYYLFACPCERIPGLYLLGEEVSEPIEDWSFVNETGLCQLQVAAVLPHSINLNCMSADGKLYLSCSSCDGKYWSETVLNNPQARIRINGRVYPVHIKRVEDAHTLKIAWQARGAKLKRGVGSPPPEDWWTFNLVSRT